MTKIGTFLILAALMLALAAPVFAQEADKLSAKQRAIVPIAAFTAKGDMAKLRTAYEEGLAAGLTVNEIKEILIQMYAYCGFPRSLNAINAFGALMDERAERGIKHTTGEEPTPVPARDNRERIGYANRAELTGSTGVGSYAKVVPDIDLFLKEHLFADIFGRGVLTWQEREIATVSAIAGLGNAEAQLRSHTGVCMNTGVTPEQMADLAQTLKTKVGEKEGRDAEAALEAALAAKK